MNASLHPEISNFYAQLDPSMVEWLRVSSWDIKRVTYVQEQLGLTPLEMHRIGLMAYGIAIIGETGRPEPHSSPLRVDRFHGFIASSPSRFGCRLSVPIVSRECTPYSTTKQVTGIDGPNTARLYYMREAVDQCYMRRFHKSPTLSSTRRAYYFQDYKTVSHRGLMSPVNRRVLVVDPIHHCNVGCHFCSRTFHLLKGPEHNFWLHPEELVKTVTTEWGDDCFAALDRLWIITGTVSEARYVDYLEQLVSAIKTAGFTGALCQANAAVQTAHAVRRLRKLGFSQFAFPVEMVSDALRRQFLGKPKDTSFQEVCAVFEHAQNAGYEAVQAWILAGYDTLEDLSRGLRRLRDLKVDVVISVFVPYTWEHIDWFKSRFPSEERLLYFLAVLHMVKSMGFKAIPLHEANRSLHFDRSDEM